MIHKSVRYIRRRDLEQNYLSQIIYDINLSKGGKFTLVSWYRQWNLPKQVSVSAGDFNCQVVRCSKFFEGCNKILEGNNDLVIIGDDNIDSYNDHNKYNNFRDHQLKGLRDNFIIQKNLTIHNDKPTFYRLRGIVMH